jgi:hypothetical protein
VGGRHDSCWQTAVLAVLVAWVETIDMSLRWHYQPKMMCEIHLKTGELCGRRESTSKNT